MYQRPTLGTCVKILLGFGSLLSLALLYKAQLKRYLEMDSDSEPDRKDESVKRVCETNIETTESAITLCQNPPNKYPVHKVLVGHAEFRNYVKELKLSKKITYFYFIGTKNNDGVSWCSDCNAAVPFIEAAWEKYKDNNSEFIMVDVGDRSTFKDKNNPFRLDREIHITDIPTLLRWKTQRRLVTKQLLSNALLEMFFTELDD